MFKSKIVSGSRNHNEASVRICQQDIVKHDLQIKAYISDIRESIGPLEELNKLNLQISENMKAMKTCIEELQTLAIEQDRESDKHEIFKDVEKYQKQFASNQCALRKANLACQTIIDKQNKEELFQRNSSAPRQRVRADKESLAKQSSSVTDSLVAINSMMAMQVKQSEEALHTLVNSSTVVTDTHEEFKSMGGVIHQSKTLLKKYGRREVTDKVLVVLAVVFFLTCIIYILQKRLFS